MSVRGQENCCLIVNARREVASQHAGRHFEFIGGSSKRKLKHLRPHANDAATDTIPNNVDSATPSTKETRRFGMHENYDYYDRCSHTKRNKGLYTADQRMRRNDQRATRQNPNGNRNGY